MTSANLLEGYFVSGDWGTSRLRLRLVDIRSGIVVCESASDLGTGALAARASDAEARAALFETTLREAAAELSANSDFPCSVSAAPIVLSGMVSSTIGWKLLPQARLPFALDGSGAVIEEIPLATPIADWTGPVSLLSGAASRNDSMRGEEVQLVGLFNDPQFGCSQHSAHALVILPGTHSKHCLITNQALKSFSTYMTGELFSVLGQHSILRHSVNTDSALDLGDSGQLELFLEGVGSSTSAEVGEHGQDKPVEGVSLARLLFQVRIKQIMQHRNEAQTTAYLAGVLIGAELTDARLIYGTALPVICAGNRFLIPQYRTALQSLGYNNVYALDAEQSERLVVSGQQQLLTVINSKRN